MTIPYSKFGQLTYEIWRACRLVVDTGLHSMNWTRQQAIDYLLAHSAKTSLDVENEIDRYISWPGQALGYKIGELKIKQLRARATQTLWRGFRPAANFTKSSCAAARSRWKCWSAMWTSGSPPPPNTTRVRRGYRTFALKGAAGRPSRVRRMQERQGTWSEDESPAG